MSLAFYPSALRVAGLVLLTVAVPVSGSAQSQTRVQVQIQHHARTVMVELNGVPVGLYEAEHATAIFQATHFLRNGVNRLQIAWRQESPSGLALSVEVGRITGGELTPVLTVEPEADPAAVKSSEGWREVAYEFEIQGVPNFTWHSAEAVGRLTDSHRAHIRELAMSLWTAFDQGDSDAVIAEISTPLFEMAGMREDIVTRTKEVYREMMADPGWSVRPLQAEALSIEGHGSLVRVTADLPVVEAGLGREGPGAEGRRVKLDALYYAFIDGDWTLVLIGI